jgi:hypothetical protein
MLQSNREAAMHIKIQVTGAMGTTTETIQIDDKYSVLSNNFVMSAILGSIGCLKKQESISINSALNVVSVNHNSNLKKISE